MLSQIRPVMISSSHRGPATVLSIHGALSAGGGDLMLRGEIDDALGCGCRQLILDFTDLTTLERRVLIIGSGGLSHDPPIPQLADAPPEVRKRLIEGGELSVEARAARQARVIDDAEQRSAGTSERTPLNPAWDKRFLDLLVAREFAQVCAMDDASITADGGCGGHEIRTWLAASAAIDTTGTYDPKVHYYRAIEDWIAGYAVMTFSPS